MKNAGKTFRSIVVILALMFGLHSWFGCGDVAAAEKDKAKKKPAKKTVLQKLADLDKKIADVRDLETRRKTALKQELIVEVAQIEEAREKAIARMETALKREGEVLERDRVRRNRGISGRVRNANKSKELEEQNKTTMEFKTEAYGFVVKHRCEEAIEDCNAAADALHRSYEAKAEKAIKPLIVQQDKLKKTWSYKWAMGKQKVAGWFSRKKKKTEQVAKN